MRGSGPRVDNRGDARGDVRGDARVRGGSFEQGEWGTRSYGGPRAVSPGVSGGMLSSSIGGADGGDGGLLEQQKALEMARVERELVEQRKRQWEQQQRLAEQREREAREREQREREREARAPATSTAAAAAGVGAPQSHYPPSQLQPSSSSRGGYPAETHAASTGGIEADTAVSWRRAAVPPASAVAPARAPLPAAAATGTAHTAGGAAAVSRPNPWGAKTPVSSTAESEKLTSSSEHLRLQQGGVQIHTMEHVLSAIAGLGIDNLLIEVSSMEVPEGHDGSSAPIARALMDAGIAYESLSVRSDEHKAAVAAMKARAAQIRPRPTE